MEFSVHARARSRRFAMQALYQWDLSGTDLAEIQRQFTEAEDFRRADRDYFVELLQSVPARLEAIDRDIAEYLDRPMDQVDPVERALSCHPQRGNHPDPKVRCRAGACLCQRCARQAGTQASS
jgi:transcription termination factor NusB